MNIDTIKRQVTFLTHKRPLPLEKPKAIQFPIIDICNSRCQMCKIWENKQSSDITVEELRKGLSDGLFSEVESIGFNGGEPTLRKDLPELVQAVVDTLPSLSGVSLITNAFKYRQVIDQIEKMGAILRTKNISFDVMISLDGFEDVHDRVRGRAGNFRNAQHVIDFVKSSRLVDNVRIGCTVIRENVNHLPDLLDFCIKNNLYIKYRQGVPHQRLYTENLRAPYSLSFEEKYEFVEFLEGLIEHYEPDAMQRFFYRSLADQIIKGAPRRAGCAWQHKGATITARGELAYCAVKSKALIPNIADGSPTDAYFGNESHLKSIIANECDDCHHDYVGIPNKSDYRSIFLHRLDERFAIKHKLRTIPGFSILSRIRRKRRFLVDLSHYRSQIDYIKLAQSAEGDPGGRRVLICGWYGTETLGDKAIIAGVMQALKSGLGENLQFTVASINPYVTEMTRRQMPELEGVSVVSLEQAVSLAGTVDYLVFGGGPMMAIEALAPMQVLFERAVKANVCTVAAGVGVGPLGAKWLNDSIKNILKLCDIRIYRDERSRENAIQLGVSAKDDLVADDPALTWLSQTQGSSTTRKTDTKKVLLLGLRDFPYREYASDLPEEEARAMRKNYEQVVVDVLGRLVADDSNIVIRPLPMCTNHFGGDDRWFYRRLFRGHNELSPNLDYSLLGPEQSPINYVEAFRQADAVLGMRFHSLVFSLGVGTNCVAIDYTMGRGKVSALGARHQIPLFSMKGLSATPLLASLQKAIESERPDGLKSERLKFEPALGSLLKLHNAKPEGKGSVA